jgi:type IV secretion system protein VirD4
MSGRMSLYSGDEKNSILSTEARHLRFLRSPMIAANSRTSSFDPAKLHTEKMTIYLVLPPEYLRSHAGWLRMVITGLLRSVIKGGLAKQRNNVTFVFDEAASLGHLEPIDDAIDKYRAYGIRCQFYYQSLGQLKQCFPADGGQTLLSNCGAKIFFGVTDLETAKLCSDMLGKQTVRMRSGSENWGGNRSISEGSGYSSSGGRNWGGGSSWSEQVMEVLRPEQVLGLPPDTAITFLPGRGAFFTRLIRYYEESWLDGKPKTSTGLGVFLWAVVYLALTLGGAWYVTKAVKEFHAVQRFETYFQHLGKGAWQ